MSIGKLHLLSIVFRPLVSFRCHRPRREVHTFLDSPSIHHLRSASAAATSQPDLGTPTPVPNNSPEPEEVEVLPQEESAPQEEAGEGRSRRPRADSQVLRQDLRELEASLLAKELGNTSGTTSSSDELEGNRQLHAPVRGVRRPQFRAIPEHSAVESSPDSKQKSRTAPAPSAPVDDDLQQRSSRGNNVSFQNLFHGKKFCCLRCGYRCGEFAGEIQETLGYIMEREGRLRSGQIGDTGGIPVAHEAATDFGRTVQHIASIPSQMKDALDRFSGASSKSSRGSSPAEQKMEYRYTSVAALSGGSSPTHTPEPPRSKRFDSSSPGSSSPYASGKSKNSNWSSLLAQAARTGLGEDLLSYPPARFGVFPILLHFAKYDDEQIRESALQGLASLSALRRYRLPLIVHLLPLLPTLTDRLDSPARHHLGRLLARIGFSQEARSLLRSQQPTMASLGAMWVWFLLTRALSQQKRFYHRRERANRLSWATSRRVALARTVRHLRAYFHDMESRSSSLAHARSAHSTLSQRSYLPEQVRRLASRARWEAARSEPGTITGGASGGSVESWPGKSDSQSKSSLLHRRKGSFLSKLFGKGACISADAVDDDALDRAKFPLAQGGWSMDAVVSTLLRSIHGQAGEADDSGSDSNALLESSSEEESPWYALDSKTAEEVASQVLSSAATMEPKDWARGPSYGWKNLVALEDLLNTSRRYHPLTRSRQRAYPHGFSASRRSRPSPGRSRRQGPSDTGSDSDDDEPLKRRHKRSGRDRRYGSRRTHRADTEGGGETSPILTPTDTDITHSSESSDATFFDIKSGRDVKVSTRLGKGSSDLEYWSSGEGTESGDSDGDGYSPPYRRPSQYYMSSSERRMPMRPANARRAVHGDDNEEYSSEDDDSFNVTLDEEKEREMQSADEV